MANRRSGYLIDNGAKEVLYTLISAERGRPIARLSYDIANAANLSSSAIIRRIDRLLEDGLIKEEFMGSMRLISITEKGKKAVKILKELDKVMES